MSPNDLVFAFFCGYVVYGAIISVSGTITACRSLKIWIASSSSPCHTLRHAKRYVETPIKNDCAIDIHEGCFVSDFVGMLHL